MQERELPLTPRENLSGSGREQTVGRKPCPAGCQSSALGTLMDSYDSALYANAAS